MGDERPGTAGPSSAVVGGRPLVSLGRLAVLLRKRFGTRMAAETWLVEAGARPPVYGALTIIGQRGPVSQRELSDLLGNHPSDMVDLVDLMERNDWVRRERDSEDRRRYQLTLTESGLAVLSRYDEVAAEVEDEVLAVLDEGERAVLGDLVARILDAQCGPAASRPPG